MLRRIETFLLWAPIAAIFVVILYEAIFEKAESLILPGAAIAALVLTIGLLAVWLAINAALWIARSLLVRASRPRPW
jgi:hypothetical protein